MLDCNQTVTLLQHRKLSEKDCYEAVVLTGCNWEATEGNALRTGGEHPDSVYLVTIPERAATALPAPGDFLALGALPEAASPRDLKGAPHFRVSQVTDRRRGVFLRHVEATGS